MSFNCTGILHREMPSRGGKGMGPGKLLAGGCFAGFFEGFQLGRVGGYLGL